MPSIREGTWIDPKGHVHDLGGRYGHESFAKDWCKKNRITPSARAKLAAKNSNWERTDAGPAFFELLLRGWVRQRGCDFTAWKLDGPTIMSIAIGAGHLWCPRVVAEECTDRGCKNFRAWPNVEAMTSEFSGLRRKSIKQRKNRR